MALTMCAAHENANTAAVLETLREAIRIGNLDEALSLAQEVCVEQKSYPLSIEKTRNTLTVRGDEGNRSRQSEGCAESVEWSVS